MAFADVEEVELRVDFEFDEAYTKMAQAALEDASEWARHYAGVQWPDYKAPKFVKSIVLNVVARYLRNPDGFTTSRAGDETVSWSDLRGQPTLRFTEEEKGELGAYAHGPQAFGSVGVYAHRSKNDEGPLNGWVGVAGNPERFFPLFDPGAYYPFNRGRRGRW